uniref:IRG-type G domain-containing protein n=1 Tax=Alexandrium catenella TaxID=2925 RepID=A0A7S1S5E5_ALECA|eukprot:CAMPEP_0171228662 /NCGR_PEP_ID=MMETSP0790-20130122/38483_1 /TAXON_ID=2925 /ORGANISM="Alexandrium catenella, Strain OF101" /LENGTH=307 /DNA_ID=CAMNT_0011694823 /DNA_START=104 /DNA_END=1027 /DNA_ORIENTATION=-
MGEILSSAAYAYSSSSFLSEGPRPASVEEWRRFEQALRDCELERLGKQRELDKLLLKAENDSVSQRYDELYQPPVWLGKTRGYINVAIAGNSGAGKSSFINAVRRIRPRDPGAAKVGVNETTMMPQAYEFAEFPRARLWDLPGAGTELFPRESYIETIGLRHFDIVIVISSQRFTETEVAISNELRRLRIPYFMVRSKVDIDVTNNFNDLGVTTEDTLKAIRDDMKRLGVRCPYLVSSRRRDMYDMHALVHDSFLAALHNRGLELEALGAPFQPDLHEPGCIGSSLAPRQLLAGHMQGHLQEPAAAG